MNFEKFKPYTMTSKERMQNLFEKVIEVNENNIEGCLVECGTWKCGMLGLMSHANKTINGNKKIYGLDSFEGLPASNPNDDGFESVNWQGKLAVSIEEAQKNLISMGADDVELIKGFFEHSLPIFKSKIEKIAILRLDGDWYSSTMICLNELYDLVTPGGFIIIDDYGHWEGCKKAVDEFRNNNNILNELFQTDYTEFWWQK